MRIHILIAFTTLTICSLCNTRVTAKPLDITSIYQVGDAVPGMDGFFFAGVGGTASINDHGKILFNALITGPGVNGTNDNILVFRNADEHMSVLAREGDPVSGIAGAIYQGMHAQSDVFRHLAVMPDGGIGLIAEISLGSDKADVILMDNPFGAGLVPIAYESGDAPGPGGSTLGFLSEPVAMQSGGVFAFHTKLYGSSVEDAIWSGGLFSLSMALRTGLQAPGQPDGVLIESFDPESIRMSTTGRVSFGAILDITSSARGLLYEGVQGEIGVLAQTGDIAPGTGNGTYNAPRSTSVKYNSNDALCFTSGISGGVTTEAIMIRIGSTISALVRDGDPFPGLPQLSFDLNNQTLNINDQGEVVFVSRIRDAGIANVAMVIASNASTRAILLEFDLIAKMRVENLQTYTYAAINNHADVLTELFLDDRRAIVVVPGDESEIAVLARQGDTFITDEGSMVTPAYPTPWVIDRSNGSLGSGLPSFFNNHGQAIIGVNANEASGLYLFKLNHHSGCIADFTKDGLLDIFDVLAFIEAFNTSDPSADFTSDGVYDIFDVLAFIEAFNAGCP